MARRVIQFPVRNAFAAQRSRDALARDPQDHSHRIAEQVENEIAHQAQRLASGRSTDFEAARNRNVTTMPRSTGFTRLRKSIAATFRSLTPAVFSRR